MPPGTVVHAAWPARIQEQLGNAETTGFNPGDLER
jgi:hypothetical protein